MGKKNKEAKLKDVINHTGSWAAMDHVLTKKHIKKNRVNSLLELVNAGWACPGNQFGVEPHNYLPEDRHLRGTGRRCWPCTYHALHGGREQAGSAATPTVESGLYFPAVFKGGLLTYSRWKVMERISPQGVDGPSWRCRREWFLERTWQELEVPTIRLFTENEICRRLEAEGD